MSILSFYLFSRCSYTHCANPLNRINNHVRSTIFIAGKEERTVQAMGHFFIDSVAIRKKSLQYRYCYDRRYSILLLILH